MISGKPDKVLVVYYTQTGQQEEILRHMLAPLQASGATVTYYKIKPLRSYPFPWTYERFFDVFPESFLQIPCPIEPVPDTILSTDYDLVIIGYQVWYLSPSIPVNSFLMSEDAGKILAGKPVVTVIGCRNMWIMAQEKVKRTLRSHGAELVGNIALVDRHSNHISLITIVHWMMKGKKDAYLGIFPKPGVSDKDIRESERFGKILLEYLPSGDYQGLQPALAAAGAVRIKPLLVFIDQRGSFIFSKWAPFIRKKGLPGDPARKPWLKLFNYYLLIALWVIAPIVSFLFLVFYLLLHPLIDRRNSYYKSVSCK